MCDCVCVRMHVYVFTHKKHGYHSCLISQKNRGYYYNDINGILTSIDPRVGGYYTDKKMLSLC